MKTKHSDTLARGSIHRKYLILFCAVLTVILAVTLSMNTYSQKLLTRQAVEYNENTLSLHMNFIDKSLEQTSSHLISFLLNEENYDSLFSADSPKKVYQAVQKIKSGLRSYLYSSPDIGGLFFYAPKYDQMILLTHGKETFSDRASLKEHLKICCTAPASFSFPQLNGWIPISIHDTPFLLETAQYMDVYVGAWCTDSFLADPLTDFAASTGGSLFLHCSDKYGTLNFPLISSTDISYQKASTSDYLPVTVMSNVGNYGLSLFLPKENVLRQTASFNLLFLILMAIVLGLFALILGLLWHQLLTPIQTLTRGMTALKEGQFNTTPPVPKTHNEFTILTETFNDMSREIQHLKIAIYEEKLQKAHTELQYLTLQIKPHFFLNSLNIIHSLALTRQYELIMEMATCLMNYFRYAFRVSDSSVLISEELDHVQNYLRIQELRYRSSFHSDFQVEDGLDAVFIPILSIQTFVENIIKHAYEDCSNMYLSVRITQTAKENRSCLRIEICDNGCGFPENILPLLNAPPAQDSVYAKKHIGIANVKQRLLLLYHGEATLHFSNCSSGAMVCLTLPMNFKEDETL